MSSETLPHTARVEQQLRLANDLELLAEELAEQGHTVEAGCRREQATSVRRQAQEDHNAHVAAELERAKSEPINLSDLIGARESFEVQR